MISDFEDYGAGELFDVKVEGGKLTGRSKIRIYYNSSDYDEAYVVGFDQAKDLALLKLDAPTVERKPVVLCSPDDSMVGSTVYAVAIQDFLKTFLQDLLRTGGSQMPVSQVERSAVFLRQREPDV